jgi:hypothetical protein
MLGFVTTVGFSAAGTYSLGPKTIAEIPHKITNKICTAAFSISPV